MATIKGIILTTPCMSTSCPNLKLYLLPRAACWVHTRPMDFTSHFIGKCNYERCLSREGEKKPCSRRQAHNGWLLERTESPCHVLPSCRSALCQPLHRTDGVYDGQSKQACRNLFPRQPGHAALLYEASSAESFGFQILFFKNEILNIKT